LLESYKITTNWSSFATQFRALENYTVDGTITGECAIYAVTKNFNGVTIDNADPMTGPFYSATLMSTTDESIDNVVIAINGLDITDAVYNLETGKINIPNVAGDIIIIATAQGGNVLKAVTFTSGCISQSGVVTSASGDVYTDRFVIAGVAGKAIDITLRNLASTPRNSRVCYYDINGEFISYSEGVKTGDHVSIMGTVPATAVFAAISINKSSGFSGIDIVCDTRTIGYVTYTA
jgi:hypothetical protein